MRYRVSTDGGKTWSFDEPVRQSGHTEENPLDGVVIGKNGIYFGDMGSVPIFTKAGKILVPLQLTPLTKTGEVYNPTGAFTYTHVLVLVGSWTKDNRIEWEVPEQVHATPAQSTRGMIEPTLAELPDGRIMMIMRGSNLGNGELPSHKWASVSSDGGDSWSKPKPWQYDDGVAFFSPSSMSQLVPHSSGRLFWVGNINPQNSQSNDWRWPLVIGEVDTKTLRLIRSTVVELDTRRDDDPEQVDLSHFRAFEDRETNGFILTYPRSLNGYTSRTWLEFRLAL